MYELFCDGACYPNPNGLASFGFVLFEDGKLLERGYGAIGHHRGMNNLKAEYVALSQGLMAIMRRVDKPHSEVQVNCDSKFVVDQLTGVCKKKPKYYQEKKLLDLHVKLVTNMGITIKFQWIPREQNKFADNLARSLRTVD